MKYNPNAPNDFLINTCDDDYRYTVISTGTVRESLNYYADRRWYKSEKDAQSALADVISKNPGKSIELAVVKATSISSPVTVPQLVTRKFSK